MYGELRWEVFRCQQCGNRASLKAAGREIDPVGSASEEIRAQHFPLPLQGRVGQE